MRFHSSLSNRTRPNPLAPFPPREGGATNIRLAASRGGKGHGVRSLPASLVLAFLIAVSLSGCAQLSPLTHKDTQQRPVGSFDARLRAIGADPLVLRAVQYRLYVGSSGQSVSLTDAAASENQRPGSVRDLLKANVDDVVIVDWLVSVGAMGAWTADNAFNHEDVSIPVSEALSLVSVSPDRLAVYRMRDRRHLMLVRAVVVKGSTVGAVGFILTETYRDDAIEAVAIQLS